MILSHALIGAVLLLSVALDDDPVCGACHWREVDPSPCETHAAFEAAALRDLGPALADEDPAARVAALKRVAALTARHAHAPSATVAQALGAALEDEDDGVRDAALDLLLDGQHPGAVIEALATALGSVKSRKASLTTTDAEGRFIDGSFDRLAALGEQAFELIETLGQCRDKRALAALRAHLQWCLAEGEVLQAERTLEAILGLGSAEGTRVAASLVRSAQRGGQEEAAARLARALDRWARERSRPGSEDPPPTANLSTSAWKGWIDRSLEFEGPLGHLREPIAAVTLRDGPPVGGGRGR